MRHNNYYMYKLVILRGDIPLQYTLYEQVIDSYVHVYVHMINAIHVDAPKGDIPFKLR